MNDNSILREFHFFVLTDYEIEEDYLRRMHRSGWRFTHVSLPGFYTFERCEPEEVIYRLDFRPQSAAEKEGYTKLFEDYGWEYLQDMNDFSYFRRPAAEAKDEEDAQIFNDNASRLAMLKRIFTRRMIPVSLLFFACVLPNVTRVFSPAEPHWAFRMLRGFLAFLFLLLCIIFGRCIGGFIHLSKKYSGEKSE